MPRSRHPQPLSAGNSVDPVRTETYVLSRIPDIPAGAAEIGCVFYMGGERIYFNANPDVRRRLELRPIIT